MLRQWRLRTSCGSRGRRGAPRCGAAAAWEPQAGESDAGRAEGTPARVGCSSVAPNRAGEPDQTLAAHGTARGCRAWVATPPALGVRRRRKGLRGWQQELGQARVSGVPRVLAGAGAAARNPQQVSLRWVRFWVGWLTGALGAGEVPHEAAAAAACAWRGDAAAAGRAAEQAGCWCMRESGALAGWRVAEAASLGYGGADGGAGKPATVQERRAAALPQYRPTRRRMLRDCAAVRTVETTAVAGLGAWIGEKGADMAGP